ncbi:acyl-CoA dehydrogenase [Streptomyces fructofermentans]|uniref:Acyl-CoA dehydrogenase n=1 Tax=Streptomyces fructofermentans TaxID=152141 RepID=A0A918NH24_9ACTN|nr:acyl-CoA dehydrogenase [Streptomyces fructofermentans]GGX67066.1 acyl-CoA dehydrogenase [Streptomyces fructofermentans]
MGIGITREQRDLAEAVRGWIARTVPPEEARRLLDAPGVGGGRPAYWDALAAQGFVGPHLPEAYGGGGGTPLDLAVVLEEAARAALPGPYAANALASLVLAEAASATVPAGAGAASAVLTAVPGAATRAEARVVPGADADADAGAAPGAAVPGTGPGSAVSEPDADGVEGLLRAVARGERIAAVALGPGTLTAVPDGDGHLLEGTAPPVLSGADADLLVLAASTGAPAGAPGVRTLWVAVDAAHLSVRAHTSADPTRATAEVVADAVRVPPGRVLGVDSALVRDLAGTVFAADACGTAARALETAVAHAKVREQFGQPIGRFQGIKHLCADMLVRVERARALAWDAARATGQPPRVRELVTALAAGTALDVAFSCAKDCVQVLGGIGFTWEHDAHLYLRRALVARQLLGGGHHLRATGAAESGARRELRTELPETEAARHRTAARSVIAQVRDREPGSVRRQLAPLGYAAPHLPPPYGLGAGPVQQLAVQEELAAAGVRVGELGIGAWVVPSLIAYGTREQQERHLLPTLCGDVSWCQLFSEPDAGSDLASLRTRAERTGDGRWRVNGRKVWTSAAQWADRGILLARTDPDAPRHRGLTYFVVDMKKAEGIGIRPLKEITGESLFNEVTFDDVLLPADSVVGEVGGGWRVARHTLGNERVHMADQLTFGTGLEALIGRAGAGGLDDAERTRLGDLLAEAHALGCIGLRTTLGRVSGTDPGAGASVRKLVQTVHQQRVAEMALELLGPAGAVCEGAGEEAVHGFLLSRCLTIAGGTTQVQLNVVAERILGLPRDWEGPRTAHPR